MCIFSPLNKRGCATDVSVQFDCVSIIGGGFHVRPLPSSSSYSIHLLPLHQPFEWVAKRPVWDSHHLATCVRIGITNQSASTHPGGRTWSNGNYLTGAKCLVKRDNHIGPTFTRSYTLSAIETRFDLILKCLPAVGSFFIVICSKFESVLVLPRAWQSD